MRASRQAAAPEAVRQLAADGIAECFRLARCALSQCTQTQDITVEAMYMRADATAIMLRMRWLPHLHVIG